MAQIDWYIEGAEFSNCNCLPLPVRVTPAHERRLPRRRGRSDR
jgi:hypothetical protein